MRLVYLAFLSQVADAAEVPSPARVTLTSASWAADNVPKGWLLRGRATPDHLLEFIVAVRLGNTDKLEDELLAVSDPRSPRYGQHLGAQDASALTKPSPKNFKDVIQFLSDAGIENRKIIAGGAFISFHATVAQAERLLGAEYFELEGKDGRRAIRTPAYHLPVDVRIAVDAVEPTLRLPTVSVVGRSGGFSSGNTTPSSLRSLYNIGSVEGKAGSGNVQATANFLGQYYSRGDLSTFFSSLYPPAKGRKVSQVVGHNNDSDPGVEAELDIQYIMGTGGGIETYFWSTPGVVGENEPFLKWLSDIASAENVPDLFSISYADYEDTVELSYAQRVSQEFMRAGLRGITIISGSGDGGVEGAQPRKCPGGKFVPTFPCASPFETCVGGTTGGYNSGDVETAVSFSGGGFANYFGVANYQKDMVSAWHSAAAAAGTLPATWLFNSSGRGFPDVASMGTGFQVVFKGKQISVGGTSASTPTFAGIASLLNDLRFQAGKPPLGFLNPLLYLHPEAFHDIVSGSNPGCGEKGFFAEHGWDPITGLGTPDYVKLAAIVEALPPHAEVVV